MGGAQNHYGTGKPLKVAPSIVLRILADLDTGGCTPEDLKSYRASLHRHRDQAAVAVGVLVKVCGIKPCHACEVLGYAECEACGPAIRGIGRHGEAINEYEKLVRFAFRRMRAVRLQTELRNGWPR
jgi:hypothetical protein